MEKMGKDEKDIEKRYLAVARWEMGDIGIAKPRAKSERTPLIMLSQAL